MATKASNFTPAGTLDGTEIVPVIKGGNKRTTTQEIADLNGAGLTIDDTTPDSGKVYSSQKTQDIVDAEATARASQDSILQDNIDAEATTRAAADTTLQDNINLKADKATNITINGVQQDLSADRTWLIKTNATGRIGCDESWSGSGLTFDVTPGTFPVQDNTYNFAGGSITLDPADATYPRFDVLALNTSGNLVKKTGTPGVNPDIPQIDPDTEFYLTAIYVDAGATTPTQVDQSLIFDEGAEWTTAASGLTADFADTTLPFHGTKDINVSAGSNNGYLKFTAGSAQDITAFTLLKLYIYLQSNLNNHSNLSVEFWNGTTKISNTLPLGAPQNFAKNTSGAWQNITINFSDFTFSQSSFDSIRIVFTGSSFSAFYLDYIQLQGVPGSTQTQQVYDATATVKGILKLTGDLGGTADSPTVPGLAAKASNTYVDAADITLQNNIDAEAAARIAADALKLNIADYNDRYKGKYTTLTALQTAYPTASAGDYAQVDAGAGHNVINYNYDTDDGWVEGSSVGPTISTTDDLTEGSTNLYFTAARAIAAVDISGKVDKNTAITGATKTKITYDAKGLVTSGADATTADIADSTNKRYVTDAQRTVISNTSGVNTGDQTLPVKAAASDLNTGTDDAKFATSLALENSKYLNQSGAKISATASGTDTYTATISPAITAYSATQRFFIKFTNANTGPATLNLNSLGAKTIKKSGSTDLAAGDISNGQILCMAYDGTNFQLVGGSGSGGSGPIDNGAGNKIFLYYNFK